MKRLLSFLLFSLPMFAALPNYTLAWEVQTGGSDNNGGCYVTGSSGTDFSQQTGAQKAFTDLVVGATTTQATSVAHPFASTDVGNCVQVISGTGCTAGYFYIVSVASVTATLDRSLGTAASVCTANEGGALASWVQLQTNLGLTTSASAWMKGGTYSVASMVDIAGGAGNAGVTAITGYTATRGDGGQPTLQATAGLGGGDKFIAHFGGATPSGVVMSHFILDCNGQSFTGGLYFQHSFETAKDIAVLGCSDVGIRWDNSSLCVLCSTTNTPSTASGNHTGAVLNSNTGANCFNCSLLGSTVNGAPGVSGGCGGVWINVTIANFTGTTADAWSCTTFEDQNLIISGANIYNITRDAIRFGENQAIDTRPVLLQNILVSKIGGYCFNQTGSLVVLSQFSWNNNNGCDLTTVGPGGSAPLGFYNNWAAGAGDVTLTAGPWTAPGSNNFALNSTTGGGKAAKAAGFPGVTPVGTGYLDIGSLQSQAGASSVTVGFPIR